MNPKEKAKEILKNYSRLVYPYEGSSMLTNTEFEYVILKNSKTCALIFIDEMIHEFGKIEVNLNSFEFLVNRLNFWEEVRSQIILTTVL